MGTRISLKEKDDLLSHEIILDTSSCSHRQLDLGLETLSCTLSHNKMQKIHISSMAQLFCHDGMLGLQ